jgi:hypothetical protein
MLRAFTGKSLRILIVCVLLAACASTARVQYALEIQPLTGSTFQSSCECKDLTALISRRNELRAAIRAIKKQKVELDDAEKKAGKVFTYTDADYSKYFSQEIQVAMFNAHDHNTTEVKGPTKFTVDCQTTTSSGDNPSCFWQGLAINEQVRQKWCEDRHRGGGDPVQQVFGGDRLGGLMGTWMGRYPLESFADVEQKADEAELAYVEDQIDRLWGKCKFGKWSGEITVSYNSVTKLEFGLKTTIDNPGTSAHQNTKTEETTITQTEFAVITLVDGYALADGMVSYTKNRNAQLGPGTWCHASTQKNAWVTWSRTEEENYSISGPVNNGASANVGFPTNGTYTVSVRLPTGWAFGNGGHDYSETGECAAKPDQKSYPVKDFIGGFSMKGTGKGKSTDLSLDGTDKPKPPVVPTQTETTITMSWHLKRSQ